LFDVYVLFEDAAKKDFFRADYFSDPAAPLSTRDADMSQAKIFQSSFRLRPGRLTIRATLSNARAAALILAAIISAVANDADAQRLIVRAVSMSVTREPTRVTLQSVDMRTGEVLPGYETLPGAKPLGPLIPLDGGASGATSTGGQAWISNDDKGPSYTTFYQTAPFRCLPDFEGDGPWRETVSLSLEGSGDVLVFGVAPNSTGGARGRIARYNYGKGRASQTPIFSWELPGVPVAATQIPGTSHVIALCRGSLGADAALAVFDFNTNDPPRVHYALSDDALGACVPSGVGPASNGGLFVLASGYAMDPPSGDSVSMLYLLDAEDFSRRGRPLTIPGASDADNRPLTSRGDSCFVVTRSPGSDMAYVTRARATDSGPVAETQIPLTGASSPVRIALSPRDDALAAGVENHFEIWKDIRRGGGSETYEAPIADIQWTNEGLFVAEAGNVHLIDPKSGSTIKIARIQTGWVDAMTLVPAKVAPSPDADADSLTDQREERLGTSPTSADTDGDGAPDAADPLPKTPSPILSQSDAIVFHEETIGQEVKGVKIAPQYAKGYSWRISYSREKMPWLVVHPMSDAAPGVVYFGVNPSRYVPGKKNKGVVMLELSENSSQKQAARSPASCEIRILPEQRRGVRRILWIHPQGSGNLSMRDPADPQQLQTLGDMLAGPPLHFTHREEIAPTKEDLDTYGVVVLGVKAAAQGAFTRQTLLRYVVDGGALLLLGDSVSSDETVELDDWLSPLGVQLSSDDCLGKTALLRRNNLLLRHAESISFAGGRSLSSTDPAAVLIASEKDHARAALLAKTYGRGRVAMLASSEPLKTKAMENETNRLFAADLFEWLAGSAEERGQDMDSDGLSDAIEDRNGNGIADPGETDYLNPDSDGDGIPDGVEDANSNGVVDEGETSPINEDSDGDGVFDGADPSPLPPMEAPFVSQVTPAQAPAEGGVPLLVSGRNFQPDATVWFGDRQAAKVRVMRGSNALVEAPPCETLAGGDVTVRVVNVSSGQEGSLPKGFHYEPCSNVAIALKVSRTPSSREDLIEGTVTLSFSPPEEIIPDKILLLLHTDVEEGFEWEEAPPQPKDGALRSIMYRHTRAGDLCVVMLGSKQEARAIPDLGPIAWKIVKPAGAARQSKITFSIEEPRVIAKNGQQLNAATETATLNLD
jgi:hypothetical protein